jgi:hypothetical protein
MSEEQITAAVAIVDDGTCRLGSRLDADVAMTLIAVASEDPNCWDDVIALWPRYQTPAVPEFVDSIPFAATEFEDAVQVLAEAVTWVLIDIVEKRILIGGEFQPVQKDDAFAMVVDDDGRQHWPLSIHLPPWWELHQPASVDLIRQSREVAIQRPVVNREVLFGGVLLMDLAERVLGIVRSGRWNEANDDGERPYHSFTIEVHRDWLMTPREDLGGLMPRQMLHGAHRWLDRLVWGQRLRFEDIGLMIAAPDDGAGYDTAPMGSQEMVIYFDLCREMIGAAWFWCDRNDVQHKLASGEDCREMLVEFLRGVKTDWLSSPFEGGSPPSFIIECCRRRVPRGAGVSIVGMTERQTEEHAIDCDCPICNMMADGMFGVGFTAIDGHHLDLDDEFAFSMHETREAWEEQQREFEEMSARIDRERADREASGESEPDEFASSWAGMVSDDPIPGDSRGHMKLAFLLAEIVSVLESAEADPSDIRQLNANFSDFRTCDPTNVAEFGRRLGEHLDFLAERYPDLVSRVADFRSRIDEQVRSPAVDDHLDFPF